MTTYTPSVPTTFFPKLTAAEQKKDKDIRFTHRFILGRIYQPAEQSPVVEN